MRAIFIHLLALLIYVLIIIFILGEHKTNVIDRTFIVFFFLCTQPIVFTICDNYNLYPKPKKQNND